MPTAIVTGVPTGGRRVSETLADTCWPGCVWSTTVLAVIGRPAPEILTLTTTRRSGLSPWLANLTVKTGVVAAGMRLTAPGCSVVGPTATDTRPWPWAPGAIAPADPPAPWAPRRSATVPGSSQPRLGSDRLSGVTCPLM